MKSPGTVSGAFAIEVSVPIRGPKGYFIITILRVEEYFPLCIR